MRIVEVLGNALKGKIVILFPAPSRIILIFKAYSMIKNKLTHLARIWTKDTVRTTISWPVSF